MSPAPSDLSSPDLLVATRNWSAATRKNGATPSCLTAKRPLRGGFLCEFFRHGKSIDPMGWEPCRGQVLVLAPSPALIGFDESHLAP